MRRWTSLRTVSFVFAVTAAAFLAGCDECDDDSDCDGGKVCAHGRDEATCETPCPSGDGTCPDGSSCVAGGGSCDMCEDIVYICP